MFTTLAARVSMMAVVVLLCLPGSVPAAPACQISLDPDRLLASIINAQKHAPLSSEMLQLMLPCPGAKVPAKLLIGVLEATFPLNQVELITGNFVPSSLTFTDVVAVAQSSASDSAKEEVLRSHPRVQASLADLEANRGKTITPRQARLLAKYVEVHASETELTSFASSRLDDAQLLILRSCLKPVALTTMPSVRAILGPEQHLNLAGHVYVSDPKLWASALKSGLTVRELSLYVRASEMEMVDLFRTFEREGATDDQAADFGVANRLGFYLASRDVDFLSTSSLSCSKIENILLSLKHGELQLEPMSIARLKSLGVSDAAILSQHDDTRHIPPPPVIVAERHEDSTRLLPAEPASANTESGPYRIGGDVSAPVLLRKIEPDYSDEARQACHEGSVLLSIIVDVSGTPRDVRVIRTLGLGLDEKAIEAVQQWRFRPGMKFGRPVPVQATIEMSFRLLGSCDPPDNRTAPRTPKAVVASQKPNPIPQSDPLRVQVMQVQWNTSQFGTTGFGKANLLEGSIKQGFEFTFTCFRPFLASDGPQYYSAKWKKPGTKLILETSEIGNPGKRSSCELKVSLQPFAFEAQNTQITTVANR